MPTSAASGQSVTRDTRTAVGEAVRQAVAGLKGTGRAFGCLFASPCHDLGVALAAAREASPGTEFVAASSGGGFTERGLVKQGVVVLLVRSDAMAWEAAFSPGLKSAVEPVAAQLCSGFEKAKSSALERGFPYSNSILLLDGLTGRGESLVDEVLRHTRLSHQVVGGAAADDWNLRATFVGARGQASSNAAAALHVFAQNPWGVGVQHGRTPKSGVMKVTRSKGSEVQELDGRPAIEAYRALGQQHQDDASLLVGHELGLYFLGEVRKARAALGVGPDGSIRCAAEVPEGSSVCILGGSTTDLIEAARLAAQEAKEGLRRTRASSVLVFDCVSRLDLLGPGGFAQEIAAIRSVFPGVPIAGFHTYGEIARFKGRMDGWHNTTAVVVALPE